jgi:hypothetical protein
MRGLACASCGYEWNLPENTRCGRCLQTLAFRPAATAGVARPRRVWFEGPRNPRELLCFLPVLLAMTAGGIVGRVIAGGVGLASSIVLLRIAHVPTDRFNRGLLMGLALMGTLAAYILVWLLATPLLRALHLSL